MLIYFAGYVKNATADFLISGIALDLNANPAALAARPNVYQKLQVMVQEYGDNILRITVSLSIAIPSMLVCRSRFVQDEVMQ